MSAAKGQRGLGGPPADERGGGFRAVGVAVSKLGAPILAKRGGGLLVRLKTNWPAIIGADWAGVSWPVSLSRDGGLKLRVAPTAALELQHRAPLTIERINVFFGRHAVTRLILVQGPLPLCTAPSAPAAAPLVAGNTEAFDERLDGISDPELRRALRQLGHTVIAASR